MSDNITQIQEDLYEHCKAFIEDNKISCAEAVGQCDWVIENAYALIEGICDIVGYYKENDEA